MENRELNKLAVQATLHCLSGCATGEILGTVVGSGIGWSNAATTLLSVVLAFTLGYAFTLRPLLRHSIKYRKAIRLALASDTLSIITMEVVDTLIILSVPGALSAGPTTALFWVSLTLALIAAFILAVPVNRYLIKRGKGHAVLHNNH